MARAPTLKQKRVAKSLIEAQQMDSPPTGGQILEKIGYSVGITKSPSVILRSEGVKKALEDYGFTEDNAKRVVGKILNSEETESNTRLKAADMTFKVHGTYAPEKSVNLDVQMELKSSHKTDELTREYEEKLLKAISQDE